MIRKCFAVHGIWEKTPVDVSFPLFPIQFYIFTNKMSCSIFSDKDQIIFSHLFLLPLFFSSHIRISVHTSSFPVFPLPQAPAPVGISLEHTSEHANKLGNTQLIHSPKVQRGNKNQETKHSPKTTNSEIST